MRTHWITIRTLSDGHGATIPADRSTCTSRGARSAPVPSFPTPLPELAVNPGDGVPTKTDLALGPVLPKNPHRVLDGATGKGEGEPINGEREGRSHRISGTPVTITAASPCYQDGGVSCGARPALAARRARRACSQTWPPRSAAYT